MPLPDTFFSQPTSPPRTERPFSPDGHPPIKACHSPRQGAGKQALSKGAGVADNDDDEQQQRLWERPSQGEKIHGHYYFSVLPAMLLTGSYCLCLLLVNAPNALPPELLLKLNGGWGGIKCGWQG